MGLFFFLANTLLILVMIYALRFPIIMLGFLLWKLRYVLLVVAVCWIGLLYYGYWRAQHPIPAEPIDYSLQQQIEAARTLPSTH